METKKELQENISKLIDIDTEIYFNSEFEPDNAGDEVVVGVTKDEEGEVSVLTWDFNAGGNKTDLKYNQTYEFSKFDGFSLADLKEILTQLKTITNGKRN